MALFHAAFASETLRMQVPVDVLLPDRPIPGRPIPVLYLLHGLSDDHTTWQRRTSIERYLHSRYLAVVLPNGHRSFYTDMVSGGAYFSYLADELPRRMQAFLPLSSRREDTFVAGLSMGGYGAFKLALNRPRQYAAAASLSGVLDIVRRYDSGDFRDLMKTVFGGARTVRAEPHNLLAVAERLGGTPSLRRACPRLFQACGTEDFLYADNRTFRDRVLRAGLPLTYAEGSGQHEWGFWDTWIREVLDWLQPSPAAACEAPPKRPYSRIARRTQGQ